jgi:hypothetical protein
MIRALALVALSIGLCGCDNILHPPFVGHLLPNAVGEPPCKESKPREGRYFQGNNYDTGDYCRFPWDFKPYVPHS